MATQRQTARREDILTLLRGRRSAPEGHTAREISEALVIHYTTANDDLNVLLSQGKVTFEGGPALGTTRTWRAT